MTDPVIFEEIPERAALGSVADIYSDIRRVLGVPMVAFVYRALAAAPGRLERVWEALAPNLASVQAQCDAASLDPPQHWQVAAVPQTALEVARIDSVRLARTLDGFDRANRLNVIGLHALLAGTPGDHTADRGEAPSAELHEMLPMADLSSLDPDTITLLERMSAPIAGAQQPILIPSLFRYFAHDRHLLETIARSMGPAIENERFHNAVAAITARARAQSLRLPYAVPRAHDLRTREIITRFTTTIPGMIVTTNLLRLAFRESPTRTTQGEDMSSSGLRSSY